MAYRFWITGYSTIAILDIVVSTIWFTLTGKKHIQTNLVFHMPQTIWGGVRRECLAYRFTNIHIRIINFLAIPNDAGTFCLLVVVNVTVTQWTWLALKMRRFTIVRAYACTAGGWIQISLVVNKTLQEIWDLRVWAEHWKGKELIRIISEEHFSSWWLRNYRAIFVSSVESKSTYAYHYSQNDHISKRFYWTLSKSV